MAKAKIHPTCRICNKLNTEMTHCAIFGALSPERVDNTALAVACNRQTVSLEAVCSLSAVLTEKPVLYPAQ